MSDVWDIIADRYREREGLQAGPDPELGQSIVTALGASPDEVAAARKLSERSGLPLPVVQSDPKRAEREAQLRSIDLPTLADRAPATAELLKDRELAKVAHDDIENMTWIERAVRDVGQRFDRGQRINELGPLGASAASDAILGREADPNREFRIRALQAKDAQELDYNVSLGNGAAGFLASIPGATAEMLPMLGSGVVSSVEGGAVGAAGGAAVGLAGGPAAPVTVPAAAAEGYALGSVLGLYASSAKQEAGHSFLELRQVKDENGEPINPQVAAGISLAVGATAGAVEMRGLGKLLRKIPGADRLMGPGLREAAKDALQNPQVRRFVTSLVGTMSESAVSEGATEGLQEFIAIAGEIAAMNIEKTAVGLASGRVEDVGIDGFKYQIDGPGGESVELKGYDAVLARVVAAMAQGAAGGAGTAGAGRTARLLTDSERARATLARVPGIERLSRAVDASKLRERDPEAFKRHVAEAGKQAGIESVYIEPQALREFFESIAPEEAEQIFSEIPELREQQEDVGGTAADVHIRLENWLSHPEMAEALRDHVRFDPLDMTAKEALGFEQDLEREVGTIQEVVSGARDEEAVRKLVSEQVRAELLKVYPETVVAPLVEITMQRMETRAQRAGKSLQQIVEEEGLFRIQAPQDETAPEKTNVLPPTLEGRLQGVRDEESVRRLLGETRLGRLPKITRGRPIIDLIRARGGVRADSVLAGELRNMGVQPSGKGSFAGLIRKKPGRSKAGDLLEPIGDIDNLVADEHPELAAVVGTDETGQYLNRQGLLDEIGRELRGESRVVNPDEQQAFDAASQQQAEVRAVLEEMGLGLDAPDETLVPALLERFAAREFNQAVKKTGPPLVAHHNLSAANLKNADRIGGLPMPSIAISSADSPMSGFGEITLVGDEGMAKPGRTNPVFPSDAWTPTYPPIVVQLKEADRKKINRAFHEIFGADYWTVRDPDKRLYLDGDAFGRLSDRNGVDDFLNSTEVRARFLFERGELPEATGPAREWRAEVERRTGFFTDTNASAFDEWKAGFFDRLGIEPQRKIFLGFSDSGNRRYKPETVENVVAYMKREMRNQDERMVSSASEFRGRVVQQFRTLKQVKDARSKLVPKEDMKNVGDATTEKAVDIAGELSSYLKNGEKNQFIRIDQALDELAMIARGRSRWGNWLVDVPQELRNRAMAFVDEMRSLPTEYFEAKPLRVVPLSEFKAAVVPEADDASAEILERYGIEVVRYSDEADRAKKIRAMDRVFFEADQAAVRGGIRGLVNADGTPSDLTDVVIRFTEAADLSTFLHESGHLWLAQLVKDAARDEGQLDADLATVKDWAREKTGSDDLFSDAVQELWARSIEAYFFEGKAPTVALERVFARFSAWLIRIYKRLRGIPGYSDALTPEIRQVMDRLIATDEQIAEAAQARGLEAIDPQALGMTAEQTAEYERTVQEGRDEAKRRLLPQLMEQARRAASKEWKELREGVRAEVEEKVNARPVFQAAQWLRTGKAIEGQPTPIVPHAKLDQGALVELYGPEIKKVLRGLYQKEGGLHPDFVAELFGMTNGDDLVRALAAAGNRREVIEQETDAEMARRHKKPETRDDLEAKALEALTNQKQIKALLMAERAVATKAGGKVIPIAIARATAERIVRGTRYRDLVPSRYRAAALKASREAVRLIAKGDYPEAQRALRLQINNLLMESEARKAIAEADRGIDYLNDVQSRKLRERIGKAGADYLEQIDGLLERFNLKKHQSLKKIDKLHGLAAWIEKQKEAGEGVSIDPKLANEAFRTSWKELSINDMLALTDAVRNVEHLARLKNKFTASRDRREMEAVRAELVEAIEKNSIHRDPPDTINPRKGYALKTTMLSWDAPIRKIQSIIDFLDGGDPNGPWRRNVMNVVNDVTNDRLELTKKHLEPFGQAIRDHIKPRLKEYTADFYSPELGLRVNRLEVLTMMLNWGSPENVQRIVDGNKFSEAAVQALIDRVATKEDWAFVKKSWGIVAGLKTMLYEDAKKASGLTPKDAETRTIKTPFGDIEGQYFPIVYDPAKSLHTQEQAEKALMAGIETGFSAVANLPGSSIERANKVMGKPILLDLSVLPAHVDEIITKVTGRDRLTQVYRLLRHEDVRKALIGTTLGEDYYKLFEGWLRDIAADRVIDSRVLGRWEKILRTYRLGYTVSKLAIRETTLAGQVLGNFNAAGLLADKLPNWRHHMIQGWKKAYGGLNPKRSWATAKEVMEASVFMRHRLETRDREVQEIRRQTIGDLATMPGKVKELAHKSADVAMSTIGYMQFLGVDLPVWLGSYNGAISELDMTHEDAVRFADSIIEMSQGGGAIKDLSAVQRGGEMLKALTVFGGYTNTAYNQNANAIRTGNATKNPWRAIRGVMFAFFIPIFGYAAIREMLTGRGGPPDDAEDWTDIMLWAIGTTLTETMNLIPILREGSSVPSALLGGGRYFDGTQPIEDFFEGLYDLATPQDAQEFAFDVVKFIAPWLGGMPPDRPVDAIEKMVREE